MHATSAPLPAHRKRLFLWLPAALAAIAIAGCHQQTVFVPKASGISHSFSAADVQPVAESMQRRLTGQVACLLKDKPGLLVGPAAAGLPSRQLTQTPATDLGRTLQWVPDGRAILVNGGPIDIEERPPGECSAGSLMVVDAQTGTPALVDSDRLLDLSAIAANQPTDGLLYAGVFQGKEGLLMTSLRTQPTTRVLVPGWSACPGGVTLSTDGALAARSDKMGISPGDGILTVVSVADAKTVWRRDESAETARPPRHSWSSPAFHPTHSILACLQHCDEGDESDAIVLTQFVDGKSVSDSYSLPPGCHTGDDLAWSPAGRYLATAGLDAEKKNWVWLLDLKEQRLWKWMIGVERIAWGPSSGRPRPHTSLSASGLRDSQPAGLRGDGLPAGAIWINAGRIATFPKDLALPAGLREATGLRRLLHFGLGSIAWVQDNGTQHEGFRVTMGDLKSQQATVLVSGQNPFGLDDPGWELKAVTLSDDGAQVVFAVRLAGSAAFTEFYEVTLSAPGKPRYLEQADVWDCVSRDGSLRVRYGWTMPDEGGANSDRYGYIEALPKGKTQPRWLWKLSQGQKRPEWAEMIDALSVSPNGTRIAYSNCNGLWVVDPSATPAKPVRRMEVMPGQHIPHIAWTADGTHLMADLAPTVAGTDSWDRPRTCYLDAAAGEPIPMAGYLDSLLLKD